jgi:hypothetical protein
MQTLRTWNYLLVLLISLLSTPFAALAVDQAQSTITNANQINGVIHSVDLELGKIVIDGNEYTFDLNNVSLIDSNNLAASTSDLQPGLPVAITLDTADNKVITVIQLQRDPFIPAEESIMADKTTISDE